MILGDGLMTTDFNFEVAQGKVSNVEIYDKFGSNDDVDTASVPEDVWEYGGLYLGFNATAGEAIELFGDAADVGTLVTSGTATGGTALTLIDTTKDFVALGVAIGDLIIDDTQQFHGIVTAVAVTTLTVARFEKAEGNREIIHIPVAPDAYRIATSGGTGVGATKLMRMLESDRLEYKSEYVILNGATPVLTVGTDYLRNSRALTVLAGSNGATATIITGRQTTTTANIFWTYNGNNKTLLACDTIPKGMTLYLTHAYIGMTRSTGAAGSAEVSLKMRPINCEWSVVFHSHISDAKDFRLQEDHDHAIPEMTDVKWFVEGVSDNNTLFAADFSGYLKTNE